ncbi:MAG TPA: response regulator, partial [Anaerolineae bacterium]|nr:response regulator [Anaerolineae bacterium]
MGKRIRVLIVEDSLVVRRVLARLLNNDPEIEVVGTARHGEEAIRIIPELKPDLVLMDVEMPVMDG